MEAGSAPERKYQPEVVGFLLAELAFDYTRIIDAAVDGRCGLQPGAPGRYPIACRYFAP